VLDYSLRELARLKALGPASERDKIDSHAAAVRKLEAQLSDLVERVGTGAGAHCFVPPRPPASLAGPSADPLVGDYTRPEANTSDESVHEAVGKAHAAVIRAAFACDLVRVATFQWSPGTNHVSFKGVDPSDPEKIWVHHPLSHRVMDASFFNGPRPASDTYVWDAMVNVNRWYFQKTAEIVREFLVEVDPLDPAGGSLLDRTVIPLITEVAEAAHTREGHAALVLGGNALGLQGGQYRSVSGIHNQLWVTVAQAFLGGDAVSKLAGEVYVKHGATPIPGLWAAPS
jgi:hypothetical protein